MEILKYRDHCLNGNVLYVPSLSERVKFILFSFDHIPVIYLFDMFVITFLRLLIIGFD